MNNIVPNPPKNWFPENRCSICGRTLKENEKQPRYNPFDDVLKIVCICTVCQESIDEEFIMRD